MSELQRDIDARRTFAIISHPDAGKTTMTEKLLLLGQAIQVAGSVKGKRGPHATSDWMALEQERGISVTSSVMQFPYKERWVNLLDTPGHEDFSEDTYRTLTAVDSALMVIDGAKGVEDRTIKLVPELDKIKPVLYAGANVFNPMFVNCDFDAGFVFVIPPTEEVPNADGRFKIGQ